MARVASEDQFEGGYVRHVDEVIVGVSDVVGHVEVSLQSDVEGHVLFVVALLWIDLKRI